MLCGTSHGTGPGGCAGPRGRGDPPLLKACFPAAPGGARALSERLVSVVAGRTSAAGVTQRALPEGAAGGTPGPAPVC